MNQGQKLLLQICIDELLAEHGTTAKQQKVPYTFTVFRSLVNTRQPGPASPTFLRAQDELLKSVIANAGVTDAATLPRCEADSRLSLWRGDITLLKADAIVNAANNKLLGCFQPGHNCIDNAIHTFAGVQLRRECDRLMRAQGHDEFAGHAKLTSAFNLPARYVLHTVGPIIMAGVAPRDEELLTSCYTSCLDVAESYGLESVAFCCISTGVFGYPAERAAKTAVEAVRGWLDRRDAILEEGREGHVKHVVFDVFSQRDYDVYEELLSH